MLPLQQTTDVSLIHEWEKSLAHELGAAARLKKKANAKKEHSEDDDDNDGPLTSSQILVRKFMQQ